MSRIQVRKLPARSAILAGRGPVEPEIGSVSTRLQVWYCNTDASWADEREHAHSECDECFVVLRGSIVVDVEGVEHVIGPREFCVFPPGVFHRIVRAVPPVEALVLRAPAGDDKVYRGRGGPPWGGRLRRVSEATLDERAGVSRSGVAPFVIAGAIVSALTTPIDLVLLLLSWLAIEKTIGDADHRHGLVYAVAAIGGIALYLAFCGIALRVTRGSSVTIRRIAVIVALAAHLGLWLGLTALAYHQMASSGIWL